MRNENENENIGESTNENDNEGKSKPRIVILDWIKSLVIALLIAFFIKTFIFNTTYVLGNSMYPTLKQKDRLFANKISLYFTTPKRGDIIVLAAPDEEGKDYIKRVIGVGGDKIGIINGKVFLNGEELVEGYIKPDAYTYIYNENYWEVPEDYVFVLGDNRDRGASKDSRYFGSIPVDSIKGITSFRYFPINKDFGPLS